MNSISFAYTKPKYCFKNFSITCNNIAAILNDMSTIGSCDSLKSGVEYEIKYVVQFKNNQTESKLKKFTSEFIL